MGTINSELKLRGSLKARKIRNVKNPSLMWQVKQAARLERIEGLLGEKFAKLTTKLFGIPTLTAQLKAVHVNGRTGERTDYGIISRKVVTTAFVNFMVDNMVAETTEWGDFKFHDSGVGVTAPAVGDTDIETTDGEARVTGSQGEGATADIYQTVGTITYTTTTAITEHGVFSQVTGGTLLDRSTFTAINVDNTDQIEFTYELTVNDGG